MKKKGKWDLIISSKRDWFNLDLKQYMEIPRLNIIFYKKRYINRI